MNIGVTDLISLEPCDSNLRPFRKIKCENSELDSKVKHLVSNLSDYFKIIDKELDELDYFGSQIKQKVEHKETDWWNKYLLKTVWETEV